MADSLESEIRYVGTVTTQEAPHETSAIDELFPLVSRNELWPEKRFCWLFCGSCMPNLSTEVQFNIFDEDSGTLGIEEDILKPVEKPKVAPTLVQDQDGKYQVKRGLLPKAKSKASAVDGSALFGYRKPTPSIPKSAPDETGEESLPAPEMPPTRPPPAPRQLLRASDGDFAESTNFLNSEKSGGPVGAYFVYDPNAKNGTALLVWSRTEVKNAAAFARVAPTKKIPLYKFQRGGKNELRIEVNKSISEYYQSWVSFLKDIKPFEPTIVILPGILNESYFPVCLCLHRQADDQIVQIKEGDKPVCLTDQYDAIAAIPVSAIPQFRIAHNSPDQSSSQLHSSHESSEEIKIDLRKFTQVALAHGAVLTFNN